MNEETFGLENLFIAEEGLDSIKMYVANRRIEEFKTHFTFNRSYYTNHLNELKEILQHCYSHYRHEFITFLGIFFNHAFNFYFPCIQFNEIAPFYVISMAPMDSTGDIYHVLAYLILGTHYGYSSPTIYLTWDIDKVKEKINLSYLFLSAFGYKNKVFAAQVPYQAGRQNSRQAATNHYFSQQLRVLYYLDQRTTTGIITHHCLRNDVGQVGAMIKGGLRAVWNRHLHNQIGQQDPAYAYLPPALVNRIEQFANTEVGKMQVQAGQRPLVIFHIRRATGTTNNANDFGETVYKKIVNYLQHHGYITWFISADHRQNALKGLQNVTKPFKGFVYNENGVLQDYSKLAHFRLLLAIADTLLNGFIGIIGNTSGTLDLAAFMGIRTYNLHHVTSQIDYQALRILTQSMQLTVCMFRAIYLTGAACPGPLPSQQNIDNAAPTLRTWLQNNAHTLPSNFPQYQLLPNCPISAGYIELAFFKTWRVNGETRPLPLANREDSTFQNDNVSFFKLPTRWYSEVYTNTRNHLPQVG